MKKLIILWIGLFVLGFSVIAQENPEGTEKQCKKEKKERCLLPEKGDWAIGVDVLPILRTLGTVFWGSSGTMGFQGTPYFTGTPYPNVSVMAKYMATDNCAIRMNFGVSILSSTRGFNVRDDAEFMKNPLTEATVTDYRTTGGYGLSLGLGAEYRVGKKRVIGIFGGDILLGHQAASNKYSYGNKMNKDNQVPTISIDPEFNSVYFAASTSNNNRRLSEKNPGSFSIGAQVTAGMEVFIAPKISLGGQVNISYVFTHNRQVRSESEGWGKTSDKLEKRNDVQTPAGWSHRFTTNNLGGSLYMMFYF